MKTVFTSLVFLMLFTAASAQDIIYSKSAFDKTGNPGMMVTPDVSFLNIGPDTIEVRVVRFYKNLPLNWTSCFCFTQCHLPTVDTLRFFMAPMDKFIIGVGFNTDSIPGIGFVKVTLEQLGGTQKDTLSFSGSTLQTGIKEYDQNNSFKIYPNPVSDKLIIYSETSEISTIKLYDLIGKLVHTNTVFTGKKNEIPVNDLISGNYFVQITDRSGKTEIKRIIKN